MKDQLISKTKDWKIFQSSVSYKV